MATDRYRIPDPKCQHRLHAYRVSSHLILSEDVLREAHASTWVCDRPACVEDAKAWVRAVSHRDPVVFNRQQEQVSA